MKRLREQRRGVTLMELLVVASIILIVTAASVPTIKPMMESQLTKQAGSTVSTYLNRARARAMATGRSCGVAFEHYSGTYDPTTDYGSASLVLRQVETPPYYSGLEQGATVDVYSEDDELDGNRRLRRIRVNDLYWDAMVGFEKGAKIQFNGSGPYYPIVVVEIVDEKIYFIEKLPGIDLPILQNATFKVVRNPRPTMTAPVGLPQGAVVDLEWSGTDAETFAIGYVDGDGFPRGYNVTVMFAPDGSVDYVENNGRFTPTDSIYFLIGRWDRISALGLDVDDATGELRPTVEDRLWNYEDPMNAWVSINPTSGLVTTTEVSSPVDYLVGDAIGGLYESREFARMSKRNIGGR